MSNSIIFTLLLCSCAASESSTYEGWDQEVSTESGQHSSVTSLVVISPDSSKTICDAARQITSILDFQSWESGVISDGQFGDSMVVASEKIIRLAVDVGESDLGEALFEIGYALANLGRAIANHQDEQLVIDLFLAMTSSATRFNSVCEALGDSVLSIPASELEMTPPSPGEMSFEEAGTVLAKIMAPGQCLGDRFIVSYLEFLSFDNTSLENDRDRVTSFYSSVVVPAANDYHMWHKWFVSQLDSYMWPGTSALETLEPGGRIPDKSPAQVIAFVELLKDGESTTGPFGDFSFLAWFSETPPSFEKARADLRFFVSSNEQIVVFQLGQLLGIPPEDLLPRLLVDFLGKSEAAVKVIIGEKETQIRNEQMVEFESQCTN